MRSILKVFLLVCVVCFATDAFAQGWWGAVNKPIPAQTGTFTIEFDVVPRDTSVFRTHITLSQIVPGTQLENGWHDNAIIIRFKWQDHTVDARNNDTYTTIDEFMYFTGESYHMRLEVDVATQTYNAFINALPDGPEALIADGFGFRNNAVEAGLGDEINYLNVMVPYTDEATGVTDTGSDLKNIKILDADGEEVWTDPGTEYVPGADFNITIDAERDDFFNTLTGPENGHIFLPAVATGTGTEPDDNIDCSGLVWFAWDSLYFYCYAEVTDDFINVNNGTVYENDCIELKIDPDPLMETTSGVAAVRLTAWGEADAEEPDGVDNLVAGGELDADWEPVEGEDYARKPVYTDDRYGYNLEFRLPFEKIVREDKYVYNEVGSIMGMAVNLHDNDEGSREAALRWAASMDDQVWANPQLHGTVTFLEGNKIQMEAVNSAGGDAVNENPEWYIPPAVAVEDEAPQTPLAFELSQNYPNPFNPTTTISYSLSQREHVTLNVYSVTGRHVKTLVDQDRDAGIYFITFNASDLSSGIYLYQLQTDSKVETKKMTFIK